MELPVDLKALFDEMTDIKAAREASLSVSVYIDEDAPADLVAHVRNAFASSSPAVRMTVTYLDSAFIPHPTDDVAIIVGGHSTVVGACAAAIRAVGVPAMVVTAFPETLARTASLDGHEIPDGDIVAPCTPDEGEEPGGLDQKAASELDERMGRWVVSACREKRLAFAIAFPFMRRALAKDAVQTTALQNAGVGLIPILPGADLPIMTLNQAKMALQISAAYGKEMDKNRAKELAMVVGGAYVSRSVARKLTGALPILGFIIRPGIAYGSTTAVGYAVIEYYEGGEDATGVANVVERVVEAGGQAATSVRKRVSELASALGAMTSSQSEGSSLM